MTIQFPGEYTANWQLLHDRFYRKTNVYNLPWSLDDMKDYVCAMAPNSGAIALIRDPRKLVIVSSGPTRPTLSIYTASGRLLNQFEWSHAARLVAMGWTSSENLVCVLEDGICRVYPLLGDYTTQFSLGEEANVHGILSAHVSPAGIIACTSTLTFIAVTELHDPRPKQLRTPLLTMAPSWYIPFTSNTDLEVFLPFQSSIVSVSHSNNSHDFNLTDGPFSHMSISANGRFVGLVSTSGLVLVCDSSFTTRYIETHVRDYAENQDAFINVEKLIWCGSDALCLLLSNTSSNSTDNTTFKLVLLGPFNASLSFSIPGFPHLFSEVDGLRIITANTHEFLALVPRATTDVFSIGSTTVSALLWDAYKEYEDGFGSCEEKIRLLRSSDERPDGENLCNAIQGIVDAALMERDTSLQKALLRAASFGSSFLPTPSPNSSLRDSIHDAILTLQILNTLRGTDYGLELTPTQLDSLSIPSLITRLLNRHEHYLANRIAHLLNLTSEQKRVAVHWACERLKRRNEDINGEVYTRLKKIVGFHAIEAENEDTRQPESGGVVAVAKIAFERGLEGLAIKLLELDPRPTKQIPFLLSMGFTTLSLSKAIQTFDSDIIHSVLYHLQTTQPKADFFQIVSQYPVVAPLLMKWYRNNDPESLMVFLRQDDRKKDIALQLLKEYLENLSSTIMQVASESQDGTHSRSKTPVELEDKISSLRILAKSMREDKELSLEALLCEDEMKLAKHQIQLTQSLQTDFGNLTLTETLSKLIVMNQTKKADSLKSEFRVPDKRYAWIKLRAIVSARDWDGLERLSKTKSSIGFVPFVQECMNAGAFEQANKYVAKCDLESQPELYEKIKQLSK